MASLFQFDAIGTRWKIHIKDSLLKERESFILDSIGERIERYDKTYSRFRADSLVTRMSQKIGTFILPADSKELFSLYRKFYDITNGKVTPLIGDVLSAAGYDAEYSLTQTGLLETPVLWDEALWYESCSLVVRKPVRIDIGAGGKGHLVDIVGKLLENMNIVEYTIDAGGDIRTRSIENSLRVGLENPFDTSEVVGVAHIINQSICGSAGSRRTWGAFHHIIDPHTLTSPREIAAVWVIADTTFLADMLATALFFVSPELLSVHFSFEYVLLNSSMILRSSPDFPGEFFRQ